MRMTSASPKPLYRSVDNNISDVTFKWAAFPDHLLGVVTVCKVADLVLGSEIGSCLDLTLRLTRAAASTFRVINGAGGPAPLVDG